MPLLHYSELKRMKVTPFVQAVLSAQNNELHGGILAQKIGWGQRRWNYIQSAFYAGFDVASLSQLKKSLLDFYELNPRASIKKRIANPDTLPPEDDVRPDKKPVLPETETPTHSQQIVKLLGELSEDDVRAGKVDLLELRNQIEPTVESERVMSAMLAHLRSWAKVEDNVALITQVKQGFFEGRTID